MPMLLQAERQTQLSAVARRQLSALRTETRKAATGRDAAAQATSKRSELREGNATLASADMHRTTTYLTVLLGMLAVYFLDVVLFAPVADFFVAQNFPQASWFALVARFLLPAAILLLEVLISVQRGVARHERLDGLSGWPREVGWTLACVALAVVMPAAVAATYMAGEAEFSPWISGPLLVALVGLSLLAHLSVLFGGRLATEAKTYYAFRARERALTRRVDKGERVALRHGRRASDLFADYCQTIDRHNQQYPTRPLQAGPFDQSTREVVNAAYGYEAIRTAPAAPLPNTAAAPFTATDTSRPSGSSAAPSVTRPMAPTAWQEAAANAWQADEHEVRA